MTNHPFRGPRRSLAGVCLLTLTFLPLASLPAVAPPPDDTYIEAGPDYPFDLIDDLIEDSCVVGPLQPVWSPLWSELLGDVEQRFPVLDRAKDEWDYGDAPDGTNTGLMSTLYGAGGAAFAKFPTLGVTGNSYHSGQPGARHAVVDVGWLGNVSAHMPQDTTLLPDDLRPSLESDADSLPDGDTFTNLAGGSPDHDGYDDGLRPAILTGDTAGELSFRVSSGPGINDWYVNVLIDFDYSGAWGATPLAEEWVVQNELVSLGPGGSVEFTSPQFYVPNAPGTPWTRITLSSQRIEASQYQGYGWDGEVPPGVRDTFGDNAFACGETEDSCGLVHVEQEPAWGEPPAEPVHCAPQPAGGQGELRCNEGPARHAEAWVDDVRSGGVSATSMVSPWTGNTGLAVLAASVRLDGMDVRAGYCLLEGWTMSLVKTASGLGTSGPGPRYAVPFTPTPVCSDGFQTEHFDFFAPNGQPLDAGDYTLGIKWFGCDGTSGTVLQNIILV